jgi:chemotaxis protein MotB
MICRIPVVLLGVVLGFAHTAIPGLAQPQQAEGPRHTRYAQAAPMPQAEAPQKLPEREGTARLTEERLHLVETNQKLQEQVDILTHTLAGLEDALAQIRTALHTRQNTYEAEQARLQQLAEASRAENGTLRQNVEQTRVALAEAQQTQAALQQQLQLASTEVQQQQQRHTETARSLGEVQTALAQEKNTAVVAQQTLQEQLAQRTQALEELQAQHAKITQQLQSTEQQLTQQHAQLSQLQDTVQQLEATITTQRQDLQQREQALLQAQQEAQAARLEVQQWQQRHTETARSLHEAQTALEQAKSTAAAQQALQEQLVQRTQALEQLQMQHRQLQDTVTQLEATLATQRAELQRGEQALVLAQQATQAAQAEAQQWQQKQADTAQALQAAQAALEQTRQEVATVRHTSDTHAAQQAQEAARWQTLHAGLAQELKDAMQRQEVSLLQGTDRLTIRVGGEALFRPGEISLRPESRTTLDKIAAVLQGIPDYVIRVEGHTDNIPVTGATRERWPSNWELSAVRAASVVRYLQEKGLSPEQLALGGYAFYRPVTSNDTPEGRTLNRRIEITLLPLTPGGDKMQSR